MDASTTFETARPLLNAVTLKEIERIFSVTDQLGISREAIVIPLRTEHPGRVRKLDRGRIEIVVDREAEFDQWLSGLETQIRSLMNPAQD